jgi:ketosteroid isomerase-like protein
VSAHADLLRRAIALTEAQGPRGLLARYDEFFTEDFHWKPALMGVLEGDAEYVGVEGFTRYWDAFEASFSGFSVRDASFIDVNEDTVLVKLRICVEGSESRVPVDQEVGWVLRFEDGRISAGTSHMTWADAEEAARAEA